MTTSINDTRKAELLSSMVEHIDITSFDARPIVEAMGKMSFTSRDLASATGLYNQMLEDKDCSIILVIAGSTSAGGCMDLYAELVRSNMVDAIVATGATIVDMDFFEALGHKHYQALEIPDDDTLRSLYIDRIYDTYIDETHALQPLAAATARVEDDRDNHTDDQRRAREEILAIHRALPFPDARPRAAWTSHLAAIPVDPSVTPDIEWHAETGAEGICLAVVVLLAAAIDHDRWAATPHLHLHMQPYQRT